jgi:hypothetical protein
VDDENSHLGTCKYISMYMLKTLPRCLPTVSSAGTVFIFEFPQSHPYVDPCHTVRGVQSAKALMAGGIRSPAHGCSTDTE